MGLEVASEDDVTSLHTSVFNDDFLLPFVLFVVVAESLDLELAVADTFIAVEDAFVVHEFDSQHMVETGFVDLVFPVFMAVPFNVVALVV